MELAKKSELPLKVVVWGIRQEYNEIYNSLQLEQLKGVIKIVALCCRKEDIKKNSYDGYPVVTKEDLFSIEFDIIVIANKGSYGNIYRIADEIKQDKAKLGIDIFIIPYFIFTKPRFNFERDVIKATNLGEYLKRETYLFQQKLDVDKTSEHRFKNKQYIKKPIIPFLVFWVGTRCTLKCRDCCNLIPYLDKSSFKAESIIKDLKFLTQCCDVRALQIQGGEPFTHPEISKIINEISKLNVRLIDIATNGTVLLNVETIKVLKQNSHIRVRISNYDIAKNKREKLIVQLRDNNINFTFYDFMYGDNSWFLSGGPYEKRSSHSEADVSYKLCPDKSCHSLIDGTLYVCGKAYAINVLRGKQKEKKFDSINIKLLKHFGRIIATFFINRFMDNLKNSKEQCRYCRIQKTLVPAAIQLTSNEIKQSRVKE